MLWQRLWSKWRSQMEHTAALVWMQAARLLPGPTRNAAEPTAAPNAAATSANTDETVARVCVEGLGAYALLLKPQPRSSGGLLIRTIRMRRVQHMQGGADDVTGLLIAAFAASTHANRPWQRSPAALAVEGLGADTHHSHAPRAAHARSREELMT